MAAKVGLRKARMGEGFGSFMFAVTAILCFRWLLFEPYVIPSGSMIPTLLIHDHILVNKLAYGIRVPFSKKWIVETSDPKRGDIVVFRGVDSEMFMIKRVVGLPGDKIEISSDGFITVNGERLPVKPIPNVNSDPKSQEPYYSVSELDLSGSYSDFDFFEEDLKGLQHRMILTKNAGRYFDHPFIVPEREYFCMGDNRDNSKDSRYWGSLPRENLLGRALFVWLSCESTLPFLPFLCNPAKLRWGRFFHSLQ